MVIMKLPSSRCIKIDTILAKTSHSLRLCAGLDSVPGFHRVRVAHRGVARSLALDPTNGFG